MRPFDASGNFLPSMPAGGSKLRRAAVKSASVTVFSGGFTVVIQTIATVILARILTPRDFGLIAMVTTFSLLLVNVGMNGITEAVVQEEQIDRTLSTNLFWITVSAGLLLTLGFAAAGSLIAGFYREPLVAPIAMGISLTIVLNSASVLHLALLKRAMMYTAVAKNDMAAKAISVAVSVLCGWAGWGYWALVAGACALPLSTTIGAWILCPWLPGRPRHASRTLPMVNFAIHTYGRFLINYFTRNTDNLLVGWRLGAPALGFYKKAYDLFALTSGQIVNSITVVAVSVLSRVREDRAKYCRYLLSAMAIMAFLGMGVSGILTLTGRDLIRMILGPKWTTAGYIFTFFGPGIGAMFLYGTHGWVHLSIGRPDRWLAWSIMEMLLTCVLFCLGLHWGVLGIAVAWGLSLWILTFPALSYACKPIRLRVGPIVAAIWRYVAASALATALIALAAFKLGFLAEAINGELAALRTIAMSVMFMGLYLALIGLLYGGYGELRMMFTLLREVVPSRKEQAAPVESEQTLCS